MMIFDDIPLDEIDISHIEQLVQDEVEEDIHLDFKRDLYGNKRKDKIELLKDVSAFANAEGGYLVIGVDEFDGKARQICPISFEKKDERLRAIEQQIQQGINPALTGVRLKAISTNEGGVVLVIFVPKSDQRPHRVEHDGRNEFYIRVGRGNEPMKMGQIEALFREKAGGEIPQDPIAHFLEARRAKILQGNSPVDLDIRKPTTILHIVPENFEDITLDLGSFEAHDASRYLCPFPNGVFSGLNFNTDGCYRYAEARDEDRVLTYVQLHRNSIVEFVDSIMLDYGGDGRFRIIAFEKEIIKLTSAYMKMLQLLNVTRPFHVYILLNNVKDLVLDRGNRYPSRFELQPLRDSELRLPSVVIENAEDKIDKLMKKAFEVIWWAGGYPSAYSYDSEGNRKGGK